MTTPARSAGFVALFFIVALLLGAAPASAQTEEESTQGAFGTAQEECMDVSDTRSVLDQLVTDDLVTEDERNEAAGSFGFNEERVGEIREQHSERWDEIATHQEEQRGFLGTVGRGAQNVVCWVGSPINAGINAVENSEFWSDAIGEFTKAVMEGNVEALSTMMTFWMDFSTTSVNIDTNTQGVRNIVMGLAGFALIASFLVGGYRMVSARRGGLQQNAEDINDNVVRWLVFSLAVPSLVAPAMVASDALADAIMTQFGSPEEIVNLGSLQDTQFGPVMMLFLTLVVMAGSVVQLLALVTRVLLVPIAAGLTPLFAALSFGETGRQGLNHLVTYLIAAIVFKPVSALLYAVVLWNVSGDGDIGATGGLMNALMIAIAGFSAPVMVRALVPAVSQAGGGGAAPMLAGATGALGGMVGGALGAAGRGLSSSAQGGGGAAVAQSTGQGTTSASAPGGYSGGGGGPGASGPGNGGGPRPSGGSGGGGSSAPRSAGGSQPSGASSAGSGRASGSTPGGGTRSRGAAGGAGTAGGAVARGARRAGATAARGGARVGGALGQGLGTGLARQAGQAPHSAQRLFDESVGVPGHYAGQVHR